MNRASCVMAICLALISAACSDSSDSPPALQPLLDRYVLASPDSVPEGITFDSSRRDFYVTSLQGGGITRINAAGEESLFRTPDDLVRLGGTKIDAGNRLLWVCATGIEGVGDRVWVYDLGTGEQVNDFALGAISANGSCNDLVLDESGIAYVTDPVNPNIYRLDASTGEGEVFATDARFADTTGLGLGLNGIEITPGGDALIVARFTPAALFRVNILDPDTVIPVALSGDNLPSPDGLEFHQGDLYTVANASISRVSFNDDYTMADVITRDQISGLSTACSAGSSLYAIKSEVTNWVVGLPLDLPFEFYRVDLDAFDKPIAPDA